MQRPVSCCAGRSAGSMGRRWLAPVPVAGRHITDETLVRERQRTIPAQKCYQCREFRSHAARHPSGSQRKEDFSPYAGFDSCPISDSHRRRSVEKCGQTFQASMQSPRSNVAPPAHEKESVQSTTRVMRSGSGGRLRRHAKAAPRLPPMMSNRSMKGRDKNGSSRKNGSASSR
jgi:hypothetical protein